MLDAALQQLQQDCDSPAEEPVVLMEMTLNNLMSGQAIDPQDFLARAEILGALAKTVMISNYTRFDYASSYLRQYTQNRIGMVVGIPTLRAIFEEQYYGELQGGILEGLGRLFGRSVKLFAYPTLRAETGELETADKIAISSKLEHLYAHLFENGFIEPVRQFSTEQLHINPGDVLRKIQSGDPTWMDFVPAAAAALIERDGLFGLRSAGDNP
jgi:DNA-binding transcriptional ArsR family regulator